MDDKDFDVETDGHTFAFGNARCLSSNHSTGGYDNRHELVVIVVDGEDTLYRNELFFAYL